MPNLPLLVFQPHPLLNIFLFEMGSTAIGEIIWLLFFAFIVYAVFAVLTRNIKNVHSHWHHMFESKPFAPLEFYETLKKRLDEKGIEGISYYSVTHSERGLLSAKRVYLRIKFREYIIDVCAAPFAKEAFFVSWWLGDAGNIVRDLLMRIPTIGKLFEPGDKTFFEQDTEIMFKEMASMCIKDAIEQLTQEKGTRLTDSIDWKINDRPLKYR